jgi:hypothetical protein
LGLPTTAHGGEEAQFAQHLVGCWQRGDIPSAAQRPHEIFMSKICFEGDVEGSARHFTCHGFETFDFWDGEQRYALTERKLHFSGDANDTETCDAQIVPGEQLRLYNCEGSGQGSSERVYRWLEQ